MTSTSNDEWKTDLLASKAHIDDLEEQIKEARFKHNVKIVEYEKDHLQREIAEVLSTKQAVISLIIKRTREALTQSEKPV
ncbi:MAG: hypothetical protein ACTMIV_03830 [Brevibacterium aurantiacum]